MSFETYRDRQIKYYQDRINQLEHENSLLRNHTCLHQQPQNQIDPYANSIQQLATKNQKLQREAENYQRQIKRQLTEFIRQSYLLKDCSFKRKYMNALSYPPPKLFGLKRI